MPLRVLVADDHWVVRAGLRSGLAEHGIEVAAEEERGGEFLERIRREEFDVVLLDVRLPDVDGLECLARAKSARPRLPVVLMTGYDNPNYLSRAIALGAAGYVTKDAPIAKIAELLKRAAGGENCFTRDDRRRVTGALATPRLGAECEFPLTHRECEVLAYMGEGFTNKQIAERMGISYETVKEHVQHILQKVGVVDRTQAVYWGLRKGVISQDGQPMYKAAPL
jgi:DNA-binding NarL/FixJ family response regulator